MQKIRRLTARVLGQPENLFDSGSTMLFESNRAVMVGACRSLLGYSEDEVRLRLSDGTVTVRGRGLTLRSFDGDQMEIHGLITGMLFETGVHGL